MKAKIVHDAREFISAGLFSDRRYKTIINIAKVKTATCLGPFTSTLNFIDAYSSIALIMLENPFPFEYIISLSPRCILIKLVGMGLLTTL